MSRDGSIELAWADGDYTFRLGWKEIIKLQEAVDAGPYYIYGQFLASARMLLDPSAAKGMRIEYIREVIRWGLIGGGKPADEAKKLVSLYVEAMPPDANLEVAAKVLGAGLMGAKDETVGEADAASQTVTN
ncbi:gene transfer agent family protein [Pseudaminobacter arsenicus]|uniref:Gene transfer agent family protein n=1 Tax=Borborobacter arsenicus TaxID=1851146 RepID=A0A432VA95_9HYPH|nr:gene transfer agent family protein [Pseudaminobacter arsenicus]RUM99036.1 gene transfer agent family protein [Pseudaminobacter arsenicus]